MLVRVKSRPTSFPWDGWTTNLIDASQHAAAVVWPLNVATRHFTNFSSNFKFEKFWPENHQIHAPCAEKVTSPSQTDSKEVHTFSSAHLQVFTSQTSHQFRTLCDHFKILGSLSRRFNKMFWHVIEEMRPLQINTGMVSFVHICKGDAVQWWIRKQSMCADSITFFYM